MSSAFERALLSLNGLSIGDAFGEKFFLNHNRARITKRCLPEGIWPWTDDTHMAISIVEILRDFGTIRQDELGQRFAQRYMEEPYRGYGEGAHSLLERIAEGEDWRELSPVIFNGGSYGNGAAMRAAPIGGYFGDNPERAAEEAQKSAVITHNHKEGQAGAIAVAVAASMAAAVVLMRKKLSRESFLTSILSFIPESEVKRKTKQALKIPSERFQEAVLKLGTGEEISAQDTVPFCLWCAANNLHDFEEALWQTVSGLGDRDTTCAIVGGIVSLSVGKVPDQWLKRREKIPRL